MKKALFILAIVLASSCGSRNRNKKAEPAAQVVVSADIVAEEEVYVDSQEEQPDEEYTYTSADGLVKVVGWERSHDGTMGSYGCRIEYKWNGIMLAQEGFVGTTEEPMMPRGIYDLGGKKYVLVQYFREWSSLGYLEATAAQLTADGLVPVKLFETPQGLSDNINVEYNIPDWYSRADDGVGHEWLYAFDVASKTLFHPIAREGGILTDRYIPYTWNGRMLSPGKEVGNPLLHPSLRDYETLVSLFRTSRNLVRVDAMPGGTFRYAAWPVKDPMKDKPDLVIDGGSFDESATEWIFKKDGHEYHVDVEDLYVLKDSKEIGRWEKE